MLRKLPKNILPLYREAYSKDFPKHHIAFGLIDHYIDRIEKFSEWEEKVHFYTIGADDGDATFVFTNGYYIHFDSLTNDVKKLKKILDHLNYDGEKMFVVIREELKDLMYEIIEEKSLPKLMDSASKSIYGDMSTEILSQFPPEFYLDDLKESDVEEIYQKNEAWLLRSKEMIETCIKYNPTTGLYRKSDNQLIGFIFYSEFGITGNLCIDKEYRRQKLGSFIFAAQYLKIKKAGKFYNGVVRFENEASRKMMDGVKGQWIDDRRSIKIVKKM